MGIVTIYLVIYWKNLQGEEKETLLQVLKHSCNMEQARGFYADVTGANPAQVVRMTWTQQT
jgi:hypothetical protein